MNGPQGGIAGLVDGIAALLGIEVDHAWLAGGVLVLGLLLSPLLLRNQNTGKARRMLSRLSTATTAAERAEIEREALELVLGNADGLVALADAAAERGRGDLARACVEKLRELGTRPDQVRRLTREIYGDFPVTVEQALARYHTQRDAGLSVAARETLDRARVTWPGHPDLVDPDHTSGTGRA